MNSTCTPNDQEEESFSVAPAIRHSLALPDGRKLSYYTFDTTSPLEEEDRHHFVLYVHGFPGSGLEGAMCANQVSNAGGQLYALDRPGFGYSDPYPQESHEDDADARLSLFCRDVWEMVHQLGWSSFSVIGVSGGGPYTLALLDSYLSSNEKEEKAEITAVSLVAGICCSAGIDDMMPTNQELFRLVSSSENSWWSRFQLWTMFAFPKLLLTILPEKVLAKQMPNKGLPQVDKEFLADPAVVDFMMKVVKLALHQGPSAAAKETKVLFRPTQGFESSLLLKQHSSKLPKISIFQGMLDVNVPPSHSFYVHKHLLGGKSKMTTFAELGHLSLVATKADVYARAAIPALQKDTNDDAG